MITNMIPFLLFTFVSGITPGANNFLIMNGSLNHGIKRCIPHYLGICFGFGIMVAILALVGGNLIERVPWLQISMQYLSIALILYLAYMIFTSSPAQKKFGSKPFTFTQACLFQWVNPKAWAMIFAAISLYKLCDSPIENAILMGSIYTGMIILCTGSWLLAGNTLKRFISNEKHVRFVNRSLAILLVLSLGLEFLM